MSPGPFQLVVRSHACHRSHCDASWHTRPTRMRSWAHLGQYAGGRNHCFEIGEVSETGMRYHAGAIAAKPSAPTRSHDCADWSHATTHATARPAPKIAPK